ncbi:MAG: thioredoxin family protein [Candidatus Rokubacteria bacterium]|nr:thioredoxin family protein [Candidatus Rokubacteria bacterium]MBI3824933.1 thioredoxin family protein [Candidatus Rokubacteria bacterium]
MDRKPPAVSPARFASGMTFGQYVAYVGTPENLKREDGRGVRVDYSQFLRDALRDARLSDTQAAAWKWLAARPDGPAKILVISEEWSSDCRRDVPMLARIAETAGLELRIFTRDGTRFGAGLPDPTESPNADLMAQFLKERDGQRFQSIPVAAFFTKDFQHLYTYLEFPAIYHKDRILYGHIRRPRPGETEDQTKQRGGREFMALQASPFFRVWQCAAVDEMISLLYTRLTLGSL